MPLLLPGSTRRQFLSTAGAVAASLTFARPAASISQQATRPLRLALLSDTHIPASPADGSRGFFPVANLAKVVSEVVTANIDGALIGGDLARLQGLPEDYDRFRELLAPIMDKGPVGMVLGNHDHRVNFFAAFPAMRPAAPAVSNKHASTRDAGGLRFVLLDSLLATDVTP